jgi:hypothetical protein
MLRFPETNQDGHMTQPQGKIEFNQPGVRVLKVHRPFYKKYNFKIVYNFSITNRVPVLSDYAARRNQRNKLKQCAVNLIDEIAKVAPNLDIKVRTEYNKLTLFLENYSSFLTVTSIDSKNIVEVAIPVNEKQIEVMDELGSTAVFKTKLFKNGYRYKLTFACTDEFMALFSAIKNVNDQLTDQDFLPSPNYERLAAGKDVRWWQIVSMYYNDPADIMMVKFIIGNLQHKVEKCVLYSEVS